MQTLSEDLLGSLILFCIFNKDWSSCETEDLMVPEEADDILMALSKLTTVALVKDHYYLLIPESLKMLVIIIFLDGTVQFLDSRYDDL